MKHGVNNNTVLYRGLLVGLLWLMMNVANAAVDLTVDSVSVSDTQLMTRSGFQVSTVISNLGDTTSTRNRVLYYLSTDPLYSDDDISLVNYSRLRGIAGGTSQQFDINLSIPDVTTGNYYVIARVDPDERIIEILEDNNTASSPVISITQDVDLELTQISLSSSNIFLGSTFDVVVRVDNVGSSPIDTFPNTVLRLSQDEILSDDDIVLGEITHGSIPATQESIQQISVTLPTGLVESQMNIFAITDEGNILVEADENNNVRRIDIEVIEDVNIVAVSATANTSQVEIGHELQLTSVIQNTGQSSTATTLTGGLFLLPDPGLSEAEFRLYVTELMSTNGHGGTVTPENSGLVQVGTFETSILASGEVYTDVSTVVIPPSVSEGSYYLGFFVIYNPLEDALYDNYAWANIQIVQFTDLTPVTFTTPASSVDPGDTFPVSLTIRNNGTSTTNVITPSWIVLSNDAEYLQSDDTYLTQVDAPYLAAGEEIVQELSVTIPTTITPGMYYLGVVADHDQLLAETDETNNSRLNPIAITYYVDYQPTEITVTNNIIEVDQTTPVSVTIRNNGQHPTTEISDARLYLSADNLINESDILLTTISVPVIAANSSVTLTTDILIPNVAPGFYSLGVISDYANVQAETNENNNTLTFESMDIFAPGTLVDQDGDGIPDIRDPDRDGDGVNNEQDTFPDDATRNRLAPVTNFAAVQQDQVVTISWTASTDAPLVDGYRLYRQTAGQTETLLTSLENTAVSYTDTTVENGVGYQYRLIAIDANENEGENSEILNTFVAYNLITATNLQFTQSGVTSTLTWESTATEFQINRGTSDTDIPSLATSTSPSYTDTTANWQQAYYYNVAALLRFTNPFTSEQVTITGPVSNTIYIEALPALSLSLNDATLTNGVYEILSSGDSVTVTGNILNHVDAVNISAQSAGQTITASSDNGELRLVLPVTGSDWTISATEQSTADRTVSITLRLLLDTTPPAVSINGENPRSIDADTISLAGTINDLGTIENAYMTNDRFSGQEFGILLASNNSYTAQMPLQRGSNIVTIFATDAAGNTGLASVTVNRSIPLVPEIILGAPVSGSVVYTNTISVQGTVFTSLPADQIRINLATRDYFPSTTSPSGSYSFSFDNVQLVEGFNELTVRAHTSAGVAVASTVVSYSTTPPVQDETQSPEIDITSPTVDNVAGGDRITVTGNIAGESPVSVTINGQEVDLTGPDQTGGSFSFPVDLTSCVSGEAVLTIVVVDQAGNSTTETLTIICDQTSPAINITSPTLSAPSVTNTITETPFEIRGTVTDDNLGGIAINGQTIGVSPTATVGTYEFLAALNLPEGTGQTLLIEAWDQAGNNSSQDYLIDVILPVGIEIITPTNNSEFSANPLGTQIAIVARFTGLGAGQTVTAAVNDGGQTPMTMDGNVGTALVVTNITDGQHQIVIRVIDVDGSTVVTTARSNFSLVTTSTGELDIERTEPENNAQKIATNQAITVYFNQPIDNSLLEINVKETVHGLTYDLTNQQGTDLTNIPEPEIVEVHRDMEPLTGALAYFPTNRYVTFNPGRRYAYDATIYVEVIYDGQELQRFNFKVKPIPTLFSGVVTDQAGVAIANMDITIPDLNLKTKSDSNGNYMMRSEQTNSVIRSGRYSIVFNPGMKNSAFGRIEDYATITEGRLNTIPTIKVPLLNDNVPFVPISSRQSQLARLSNGNLQLDLTNTDLTFPNGRGSGNIHVMLMPQTELSFRTTDIAIPYWMYSIQPSGISVRGTVGVRIEIPQLYGARDYKPAEGTYVIMLGFNNITKTIEPVGVGQINGMQVVSVGSIELKMLNYLGYAFVDDEAQPILERYVNGEIDNLISLRSELENLISR